jgi:Xaa-Pro aminopeptidase
LLSTAYDTIVAGGANSCVLHYTENNKQLNDGELVLVDAGGEYKYCGRYHAHISVNGRFSGAASYL